MSTVQVDPSISKVPIETNAKDRTTVCVLCSHNCSLTVDIHAGHIENIRADESSPLSHGYICNKGFSVDHYVNHAQRLSHRSNASREGGFEQISWDQAVAEIAERSARLLLGILRVPVAWLASEARPTIWMRRMASPFCPC